MSRYIDADALIAELQKDEERFDKEVDDCRKKCTKLHRLLYASDE